MCILASLCRRVRGGRIRRNHGHRLRLVGHFRIGLVRDWGKASLSPNLCRQASRPATTNRSPCQNAFPRVPLQLADFERGTYGFRYTCTRARAGARPGASPHALVRLCAGIFADRSGNRRSDAASQRNGYSPLLAAIIVAMVVMEIVAKILAPELLFRAMGLDAARVSGWAAGIWLYRPCDAMLSSAHIPRLHWARSAPHRILHPDRASTLLPEQIESEMRISVGSVHF